MVDIKYRINTWFLSLFVCFILLLGLITLYLSIVKSPFRIIACDVGQGDAILMIKGTDEILIDSGPDGKVVNCLEKYLPFWDRTIEVMILTHPEKDHYGGFLKVLSKYNGKYFVTNGYKSSNEDYQVLENKVGGMGIKQVVGITGTNIRVGLISFDVVNPDKSGNGSYREGNETCIVGKASFKTYDMILTCDIEPPAADFVAEKLALIKDPKNPWEYIKVPHHGSKNGLTRKLLEIIDPKMAVISVGENKYGHPSPETLEILRTKNIEVNITKEKGDIVKVID